MLILKREIGKAIFINDDIRVAILGVKGKQVKLGISAPANVVIYREEVRQRIKKAVAENSAGEKNEQK